MADYKLNGPDESRGVIRTADGAIIPNDEENRDWIAYLEWKAADPGVNIPDPQYTTEEQAEVDRQAAIFLKLQEMTGFDRQLLKLLVIMYQVGVANGHWIKGDFTAIDPNIVDDVQAMRTRLTELEALEAG